MVVVEVRQGPLQDEEERREGGGEEEAEEEDEEKEAATNIKSNNPHLAGGEKCIWRHQVINSCADAKWDAKNVAKHLAEQFLGMTNPKIGK